MIYWQLSDLVVLLFTVCLIQNILFMGLFVIRERLMSRADMRYLDRIMKGILLFALLGLPLLAELVLYKLTYVYVGPPMEGSLTPFMVIRNQSIASGTFYGNHFFFIAILILWLSGAVWKGLRPYRERARVLKRLMESTGQAREMALDENVRRLKQEVGVRRKIYFVESERVQEPFVIGFFRQRLFFPKVRMDESQRELLLKHELVHCRKGDSLYRQLLSLLCSVYWFNPFLSRFADWFVEISEMACDEEVLGNCSKQERGMYAELLILFGQGEAAFHYATALTGHSSSGLERRLENMLNMKKRKEMKRWSQIALAFLLAAFCPLTAFAASTGVSFLQHMAVEAYYTDVEVKMEPDIQTEITDFEDMGEMRDLGLDLRERRSGDVDATVYGMEAVTVTSVSLSKGGKIALALWGDSTSDKFRAGYVNPSGMRTYVEATNGELDYTFTVSEAGTYKIFIQGTSTKTIHVTGSVTVR